MRLPAPARWILLAATLWAATIPAAWAQSPPEAQPEEQPRPLGAESLEGLAWGASHAQVIAHFEKLFWQRFTERKKSIRDPIEIERLRRRTEADVAGMRSRHVEFAPGSTAYRVSIIEEEFKTGTNEAVFRIDDAEAQRYYFFINDRLWKVFFAYSLAVARAQPFPSRREAFVRAHGPYSAHKTATRKVDGAPTEVISEVRWEDATDRLRLEDRSPFFGTYVLILTERTTEDRIGELRGELPGADAALGLGGDASVRSMVGEVEADDAPGGDEDIIDRIVGQRTEVDVVREMPISEDDFQPVAPESGAGTGPAALPGKEPTPAPAPAPGGTPGLEGASDGPIIY